MTIQPMSWYARLDKAETDVKVLRARIKDLQDAIMKALDLLGPVDDDPTSEEYFASTVLRNALLGELSAIAQEDI